MEYKRLYKTVIRNYANKQITLYNIFIKRFEKNDVVVIH